MAKGLEYYRTCPQIEEEVRRKFVKSKPVEELLQLLNDCFDTMNARRPRDGIKKEKWQEKKEVNISSLFCLMKAIYVSLMNANVTFDVYRSCSNWMKSYVTLQFSSR